MSRSYIVTEAELHSLAARVAGSMAACLQEGVTFVSGDEVDQFLKGRTEAKVSGDLTSQSIQTLMVKWADSQGFQVWLSDHRAVMRNLSQWLESNLPAPQSPVVPSISLLTSLGYEVVHNPSNPYKPLTEAQCEMIASAIHAHLLANARESREGTLLKALGRIVQLDDHGCGCQVGTPCQCYGDESLKIWRESVSDIAREALATVGKEV